MTKSGKHTSWRALELGLLLETRKQMIHNIAIVFNRARREVSIFSCWLKNPTKQERKDRKGARTMQCIQRWTIDNSAVSCEYGNNTGFRRPAFQTTNLFSSREAT